MTRNANRKEAKKKPKSDNHENEGKGEKNAVCMVVKFHRRQIPQ
jgi:hypothetical protein